MTINSQWRVMCFDRNTEKLVRTIDLGSAPLNLVRDRICPTDDQQMCGSYELSNAQLIWLSSQFQNQAILANGFDMFLERES